MPGQTTMLHVRVDEAAKTQAAETLSEFGLTLSEAVRILVARINAEGGLPVGLTADPGAYDAWFRSKVREAIEDQDPAHSHDDVMKAVQARINGKVRADS